MDRLPKILVIDDEIAIRMSHGMYFEEMGHEVQLAESGELALEVLAQWQPDVVLVDHRLPGIQGVDLIREIRQTYPKVLTLLYTGNPDTEIPSDLVSLGIGPECVVAKPCVNLEFLRQLILKHFEAAHG